VAVNECCSLTGPLDRADVSVDGTTIDITGYFQGTTLATINGQLVPMAVGFSTTTGASLGRIDIRDFYEGQKNLTVCSGGVCSTRVIYITRRGMVTPPPLPGVPSQG
jgi:hypothetical protein